MQKDIKAILTHLKKLKIPTPAQSAKMLVEFFEVVFIAVGVFIVVYIFVAQLLRVNGDSMFPTFKDGEQLVAEKLSIKLKPLIRGDSVVFKHPQNPDRYLIKRVIGLPGDIFTVNNGMVTVNGTALREPYVRSGVKTNQGATLKEGVDYQIPQDEYIVLGDNRDQSSDSRDFGSISKNTIVGRVLVVYYPLTHFKFIL